MKKQIAILLAIVILVSISITVNSCKSKGEVLDENSFSVSPIIGCAADVVGKEALGIATMDKETNATKDSSSFSVNQLLFKDNIAYADAEEDTDSQKNFLIYEQNGDVKKVNFIHNEGKKQTTVKQEAIYAELHKMYYDKYSNLTFIMFVPHLNEGETQRRMVLYHPDGSGYTNWTLTREQIERKPMSVDEDGVDEYDKTDYETIGYKCSFIIDNSTGKLYLLDNGITILRIDNGLVQLRGSMFKDGEIKDLSGDYIINIKEDKLSFDYVAENAGIVDKNGNMYFGKYAKYNNSLNNGYNLDDNNVYSISTDGTLIKTQDFSFVYYDDGRTEGTIPTYQKFAADGSLTPLTIDDDLTFSAGNLYKIKAGHTYYCANDNSGYRFVDVDYINNIAKNMKINISKNKDGLNPYKLRVLNYNVVLVYDYSKSIKKIEKNGYTTGSFDVGYFVCDIFSLYEEGFTQSVDLKFNNNSVEFYRNGGLYRTYNYSLLLADTYENINKQLVKNEADAQKAYKIKTSSDGASLITLRDWHAQNATIITLQPLN